MFSTLKTGLSFLIISINSCLVNDCFSEVLIVFGTLKQDSSDCVTVYRWLKLLFGINTIQITNFYSELYPTIKSSFFLWLNKYIIKMLVIMSTVYSFFEYRVYKVLVDGFLEYKVVLKDSLLN